MSIQSIQGPASTALVATQRDAPGGETVAPVRAANALGEGSETGQDKMRDERPARLGAEQIESALEEVRAAVQPVARSLLFSLDDESGRTVIKVVDSVTNEMIRQIPSEEILAIARAVDKLQGLLIEQKA